MMNGAQEVGFLLLQRQISLSAIRALLSIMVTYSNFDSVQSTQSPVFMSLSMFSSPPEPKLVLQQRSQCTTY